MIPIVTLWHFEHPAWVEESGSVHSPCFLTYFKEYVEFLIPEISSLCNIYHTINEPIGFASTAYLGGVHPPGRHRFSVFMDAVSNLYKCHVIAYDIIKKHNPSALVSYAKNIVLFVPLHKFSLIELAVSAFLNVYDRAGFEVFSQEYIKIWGFTRPVPGIKGKLDFISINHYYCGFASLNPKDWGKSPYPMVTMGERYFSMSDFGWSLIPDSLSASIRWLDKHYNERIFHKKLHFFVTENGCADEKDIQREVFLIETLKQLRMTMNNGPLVDGYLVWSLIDNYEWAEGREKKFGLYQVNYDTQERIQRHSAVTYQSIILNSEKPRKSSKIKDYGVTASLVFDLHGNLLQDALDFVGTTLKNHPNTVYGQKIATFNFIPGKGLHSEKTVPILKPKVLDLCMKANPNSHVHEMNQGIITVPNEDIQTNFEIPKEPTTNQFMSREIPCELHFDLRGIDVGKASEFVESVLTNFEENCCGKKVTAISFETGMGRETNNDLRDAVLKASRKYFPLSHEDEYVHGMIYVPVA